MIPSDSQTIRKFILSCPTFVPEHGELGRTKAGWLHKVLATHVFLYFCGTHVFPFAFPRVIFLGGLF